MTHLRSIGLVVVAVTLLHGASVVDYQCISGIGVGTNSGDTVTLLRRLLFNETPSCLVVNPVTLVTSVVPANLLWITILDRDSMLKTCSTTPYCLALAQAELNDSTIQDAGITRFPRCTRGINLTVDLCPSKRALARGLFTSVFSAMGTPQRPVPVGISVSGLWMKKHPDDLSWLKQQEAQKRITITWINHSYNHRTAKNLPLKQNFMLEKGTNVTEEILNTEILMLCNDITPSVFFRFPGLISDSTLLKRVASFGLIPVGSDAWLAKNQWPKRGSIILIHGNGNEPLGIRRFLDLIKQEPAETSKKQWLLYDLRESVIEQESTD